jgi:hypothetical protein
MKEAETTVAYSSHTAETMKKLKNQSETALFQMVLNQRNTYVVFARGVQKSNIFCQFI